MTILIFQGESLSSDISRWWLGLSDYDEEVTVFFSLVTLCLGTPSRAKSSVFFNIVQTEGGGGGQTHVADFVYFWALFCAIIHNTIRNINVQKRGGRGGGSKAV